MVKKECDGRIRYGNPEDMMFANLCKFLWVFSISLITAVTYDDVKDDVFALPKG